MSARQFMMTAILILSAAASGCMPASSREKRRGIGRTAQGPINNFNGSFQSYQSGSAGTSWGQVTSNQGDQMFGQQLYLLAWPMLNGAPADQQLGYVSSSANQSTNVVFWGQVSMSANGGSGSGNGTVESAKARIHIEIWDNKAASGAASPVVLHIGNDFEGYAGASGSVQNNQATVTFTDSTYGAVALQGTISGQYFSGTMYFRNQQTGGQFTQLGNFQVMACGFFICN